MQTKDDNKIRAALELLEDHHKQNSSNLDKAFSGTALIEKARMEIGEDLIILGLKTYHLAAEHYTRSTVRLHNGMKKGDWTNLLREICFLKNVRFSPDPNYKIPDFETTDAKTKAMKQLHAFYKEGNNPTLHHEVLTTERIIELLIHEHTKSDIDNPPAKERIGRDIDIYPEDQEAIIEFVKGLDPKTRGVINHYYRLYSPIVSAEKVEELIGPTFNMVKAKDDIKQKGKELIADFIFKDEKKLGSYYETVKELQNKI